MADTQEAAPQQSVTEESTGPPRNAVSPPVADSLWDRIKRHKVVEWALAYIAFGYAALHASQMLRETFEWSVVVLRFTLFALLLGFPIAVTLAWYHGHRAQHRVSRIEISLLAALLLIAGSVAWLLSRSAHERIVASVIATSVARPAAPAQPVFSPPAHSIAVLPFLNMSGDPKQQYFSDGITEETLNALSNINDLQVMARTSSFSFKGKDLDVSTIAHQLNVGAILEGSVRRDGNTVRVTVQLINAVNGFHLWSQTYDRKLTDILKVQTDVATSVAQQLEVKLIGDEAARLEAGETKIPKAYDAYLRGMQLITSWQAGGGGGLRPALAAFDQAIALDSGYARAYAERARVLGVISYGIANAADRARIRQEGLEAAERAVALAPQLGEVHMELGETLAWRFLDFTAAAPEFDRALALSPGSVRVQNAFALFSGELGHLEAAVNAARRAVSLDPQNLRSYMTLGEVLLEARRYDEAVMNLRNANVLNPGLRNVGQFLFSALLASSHAEQARQLCESLATPLEQDDRRECLALAYHQIGRQMDAEREFDRLKALDGDAAAYVYSGIYAQWGDKALALQWLSKAERSRDPLSQFLRVDWELDPIRNEPEFKAIEARMKFPP